ncbi:hypothetical protein [Ramlibacter alkalitolerans]|uniref:Uncharacterized protein n=2 Tax=Ramlibacter alkalitolerans TaxID=2039631 RepID=A0ABS1JVN1_9BURK|nr:hypothetical protein [Ramlibacter alkalitolerans]
MQTTMFLFAGRSTQKAEAGQPERKGRKGYAKAAKGEKTLKVFFGGFCALLRLLRSGCP